MWCCTVVILPHLINYMNNNYCNLKFTCSWHQTEIQFYDLYLSGDVANNCINTKTYRKSVAGNTILKATTCHPVHTLKGIPVGEMTRAKRNCSSHIAYLTEEHGICETILYGC